jgi:hypothetical protein
MGAPWLFLWLGTLVHALTLYGYNPARPAALLVLLPLVLLPFRHRLSRYAWIPRWAGPLALLAALAFLRLQYLAPWDTKAWAPTLAFALTGALALLADGERPEGPSTALWIGVWMLTGTLDPVLPVLGLGVAAALHGLGTWPTEGAPRQETFLSAFAAFLLLGLALPKPWWDFGLESGWAAGLGAFGAAWALAQLRPLARLGARLPGWALLTGIGTLAVLYWPTFVLPWGAALGLLWGWAWMRLPRKLETSAWPFLLGLLLSFALHANAWLPGLRHLIWLGN